MTGSRPVRFTTGRKADALAATLAAADEGLGLVGQG